MLALMVCSLLVGQPPAEPPKAEPDGEVVVFTFPADKPDDLQAALANHPDVQIAEAKLRVAQAELAKVKLLIAQQVTAARAKLSQAKTEAEAAETALKRLYRARVSGKVSAAEAEQVAQRSQQAKAALAVAEADLRAVLGAAATDRPPPAATAEVLFDLTRRQRVVDPQAAAAPAGPASDKLRAALAANWKLDLPEDAKLVAVCDALAAALAPHGLTLRAPPAGPADGIVNGGPFKGEQPLGQWLQAVADTFSGRTVAVTADQTLTGTGRTVTSVNYTNTGQREFYVRDYGLLFTTTPNAPPGALTLAEFARQVAADRPVKPAPAELSAQILGKVKDALAKTVKLPEMDKQKPRAVYQAILNAAGLDMTFEEQMYPENEPLSVEAGERTVAAWFEMLLDRRNEARTNANERYSIFVREYGLLAAQGKYAPPGAVPLSQLK